MIHEVIPIIAGELKDYLESKFGSYEDVVIISNFTLPDQFRQPEYRQGVKDHLGAGCDNLPHSPCVSAYL